MGINAFTALGKTVKLVAASSAPTPVQVPSTILGGNQYRVINLSSNTAAMPDPSLPLNPEGYIQVVVNGTTKKISYYGV